MATTLYPGIPFSPQATLTDNIGAADTIIPVSDVSAFPAAPNLATIGTDEDGETILYAAKTANALSGCQRGVEGTAKAWQMGEIIARNFTAKDHNDLIAKVQEAAKTAEARGVVFADGDTFQEKYDSGDLDGDSAYQLAVNNGFTGTEKEWLSSLKGDPGTPGTDGKTAYQYAVDGGYTGTEEEFQALMGSGPWLPLEDGVRMVSAVIPKGRMLGDVDGDGKITQADVDYITKGITLTDIERWCADINGDGSVNVYDSMAISSFLIGNSQINFKDYYKNWTYVSEDGQDPYWFTTISVPGITEQTSVSVVVSGMWMSGMFSIGEIIENGIRIRSIAPPITDVPCTVFYGTGDGSVVVYVQRLPTPDDIGAVRTPKIAKTFLNKTSWDENNQQRIQVDGVSKTENDQIIQVIPRFSATEEYNRCNITFKCDTEEDGFLIFHAETIPTKNLGFRVLITDLT